jgi:hypothetical protein
MRFIYADSLDFIDPHFDFLADRNAADRKPYWDDVFPHEYMDTPPYDGMLVSRGIVGDHRFPGKYTDSQAMRFRRVGAKVFLRLNHDRFAGMPIYGDCGAFSYHREEVPPYSSAEMVEFYADGGFTHGCSVDHVIFDFDQEAKGYESGSESARSRYDITLENAETFLDESSQLGEGFVPLGVVQGWSPDTMAEAARSLVAMGYKYLAVGGMVPLSMKSIASVLNAIQTRVPADTKLHLLGFAKAESIDQFEGFRNLYSFDSTSPLLRAFKDSTRNYYVRTKDGDLDYYTAIRIPQAIENSRLTRRVKEGRLRQEDVLAAEHRALQATRALDKNKASVEEALDGLLEYAVMMLPPGQSESKTAQELERLRKKYARTLGAAPWKECRCAVCRSAGIEVAIFRGSNRNKRRGIHNLSVYYEHLKVSMGANCRA